MPATSGAPNSPPSDSFRTPAANTLTHVSTVPETSAEACRTEISNTSVGSTIK